MLLFSDTRS